MATNQISQKDMQMLVEANKLTYSKLIDGSFTHTRQYRTYTFSPSVYDSSSGGSQMEINIGSSSDFIYGPNSFFLFNIRVYDDLNAVVNDAKFANPLNIGQSAMNLFRTAEFTHRSGDILDRTAGLNALAPILLAYGCDESLVKYYSGAMGGKSVSVNTADAAAAPYPELRTKVFGSNPAKYTDRKICLPLWLFSGLFSQDVLLPGLLVGGMRVRLEMESFANAIGVPSTGTKYKISGMSLVLDSYMLIDSVVKELMAQSADVKTQGLQFTYTGYHHIPKQSGGTTSDDLTFSAGQVLKVIMKRRDNSQIAAGKDSLGSAPFAYTKLQARLGSLTYPRSPLSDATEAYQMALQAYNQLPVNNILEDGQGCNVGVSHLDYSNDDNTNTRPGVNVAVFDFEKNQQLKGIGELTNNARLITVESEGSPGDSTHDYWVKHVRVVNIMQNNVVVNR